MTSTVRRACAFAAVSTLALAVPVLGRATTPATSMVAATAPFVALAVLSLYVIDGGPVFELFARPGDHRDGRLYGLAGFSLAAAGLALLSVQVGMPAGVLVASVLVVGYGNLGEQVVRRLHDEEIVATGGFAVAGFLAGAAGQLLVGAYADVGVDAPTVAFLAASGALLGALLRSALFAKDDPLVMVSVALLLWLFADLPLEATLTRVAVALAVTAALGYVSYALETASVTGMLTGVFLGLLAIVLGDYGWFAMLIAFFGLGGLSTKFRYEEKRRRGIAEDNEGARGGGNVLANSLVALVALVGAAASPSHLPLEPAVFLFAFAGSIAAAMSDTLSSEIGGLFDGPRLITTLEPVPPGTDGAVTWQGEVAGLAGAAVVAAIATVAFGSVGTAGAAVVLAAGLGGMTVDSLLGATLEGRWLGNQGVNLLSTLAAAVLASTLALAVGLAAL